MSYRNINTRWQRFKYQQYIKYAKIAEFMSYFGKSFQRRHKAYVGNKNYDI